jgi:hypothetical protein
MEFLLIIISILYLFYIIMCWKYVFREPTNITFIVSALNVFFYFVPAWAWVLGKKNFSYVSEYFIPFVGERDSRILFIISTLIGFAFLIGGIAGHLSYKRQFEQIVIPNKTKYYNTALIILYSLWAFIVIIVYRSSNTTFLTFLAPISSSINMGSGYIKNLYLAVPITIISLQYARNLKFTKLSVVTIFICTLLFLATGQRRDVASLAIFLGSIIYFTKYRKETSLRLKQKIRVLLLGFISISMIPVMWWLRSWFTQKNAGNLTAIKPWENRGFLEIIFGGQASGFPTLLLIEDWVSHTVTNWFYSFKYLAGIIVPRSLWEGKYIDPDSLIQKEYFLTTDPSLFLINEMYLNFKIFAIPFAFIFGFILSRIHRKLFCTNSILHKAYLAVLFSNVIALFKNGFSVFFINATFMIVIIQLFYKVSFTSSES